MTDCPIIFSAPMVRALLDGRKTQTRRVLKPQLGDIGSAFEFMPGQWRFVDKQGCRCHQIMRITYAPGDRLYVREAHSLHDAHGQDRDDGMRWGPWPGLSSTINPEQTKIAYYREGFDRSGPPKWRPSIHMPRWASRLTLTVTDVRVQRLKEISAYDVQAEGACELAAIPPTEEDEIEARAIFRDLWNSLHGPAAWDANPWVVALTFTVQHGNIDQIGGVR